MKSKKIGQEKNKSEFSAMLEQSFKQENSMPPGAAVIATVTNNKDRDFIFIKTEFGAGVIPRAQLIDDGGNVRINQGEKIHAFFQMRDGGENLFTILPEGRNKGAIIKSAMENRIPLRAKVSRKNKGGYELIIGEVLAFCPMSLIDSSVSEGDEVEVLITEAGERRIIASQRAWRDIERDKQKEVLQQSLSVGDIVTGKVKSLLEFGAFVDLGGFDGMIPVSEMSYQRPGHPREILKIGQDVRVRVQDIDWKENRLTLSMRALLDNPWQGTLPFAQGDVLEGTVDSVKAFGVFVKLPQSFTGLIPASESGVPRGKALDREFQRGQTVRIMIQNIDRDRQKIGLSIRQVQDSDTQKEYDNYIQNQGAGQSDNISSFGKALMQAVSDKDKKKQQP